MSVMSLRFRLFRLSCLSSRPPRLTVPSQAFPQDTSSDRCLVQRSRQQPVTTQPWRRSPVLARAVPSGRTTCSRAMSAMGRLVVPSTVAAPEYDATQLAATSRRPEALTATRLQRWLEGTPCKDTDTRVPADRGRSTNRALTGLPGRPAVATTGEVAPPGAPTSGERPTRNTA